MPSNKFYIRWLGLNFHFPSLWMLLEKFFSVFFTDELSAVSVFEKDIRTLVIDVKM